MLIKKRLKFEIPFQVRISLLFSFIFELEHIGRAWVQVIYFTLKKKTIDKFMWCQYHWNGLNIISVWRILATVNHWRHLAIICWKSDAHYWYKEIRVVFLFLIKFKIIIVEIMNKKNRFTLAILSKIHCGYSKKKRRWSWSKISVYIF